LVVEGEGAGSELHGAKCNVVITICQQDQWDLVLEALASTGRRLLGKSTGRHVALVVPKTVAPEGQRMTLQPALQEQRARQVGHVVGAHDDAWEALRYAPHLRLEPQDLPIRRTAGPSS